jgi:hypothetical protein
MLRPRHKTAEPRRRIASDANAVAIDNAFAEYRTPAKRERKSGTVDENAVPVMVTPGTCYWLLGTGCRFLVAGSRCFSADR